MIHVRHVSGYEYEVKVTEHSESVHRVTLHDTDRQRLSDGGSSPERLIEESFRFLLEREPNTSILREFDLPVIARYFPEYESEIRSRLQEGSTD